MVTSRWKASAAGLWLILLLLAAWAYWPGLSGPLLLDDWENLKTLERIDINPDFMSDVWEDNISGPAGRPISMLSFALEKRFVDDGVRGQKLTNLLIHLFNGSLVLLLLSLLLRAGSSSLRFGHLQLLAGFWLLAPLLLSTTLYVVQRMTLLSASFSLLTMIFYCMARDRQIAGKNFFTCFLLSALCVPLAFLSKENGLLVLPMLSAIELFVYRAAAPARCQRRALVRLHAGFLLLGVTGFLLVLVIVPGVLLGGYADRDFTLLERQLSQFRFLWHYLAQFFAPDVHLLGLYHDDVKYSTGLGTPRDTLPALIGWLAVLLGIAVAAISRKVALLGLGASIYLLGHAMESTILPLEMYFEHRSYLPSVGLLLFAAGLIDVLQQRYAFLSPWVLLVLLVLVARNALLLGSQSMLWSDNNLLHMEAANYHPQSARALAGLSHVYARNGALDEALLLVDRGAEIGNRGRLRTALVKAGFYCGAGRALPPNHWQGLSAVDEDVFAGDFSNQFSALLELVTAGSCAGIDANSLAEDLHDLLFGEQGMVATPRMLGSLMFLENHLQHYEKALGYADQLQSAESDSVLALQFQLYLSSQLELPLRRDQALTELKSLRDRGELSRQEQYNLELFLEE